VIALRPGEDSGSWKCDVIGEVGDALVGPADLPAAPRETMMRLARWPMGEGQRQPGDKSNGMAPTGAHRRNRDLLGKSRSAGIPDAGSRPACSTPPAPPAVEMAERNSSSVGAAKYEARVRLFRDHLLDKARGWPRSTRSRPDTPTCSISRFGTCPTRQPVRRLSST
jgi:hypothetical protein